MATLTVGPGEQFSTIPDAIASSQNGDVINVDAGTYNDQFVNINDSITLQAVGGMVNMTSDTSISNGKAIIVTNGDIKIDGFSFSGAFVPDNNGAGIRYESGNLILTNDYFHDNQEGLLAAANPTGTITIDNTEFDHNGDGSGFTHNLYVGEINTLTITNSYFHDAVIGHEIKSRADNTIITNNRIQDESGSASYSIDAPNGGNVTIQGNVIEQGPFTQNPTIVAIGEEGNVYSSTTIIISGNTILNDNNSGSDLAVSNATPDIAQLTNNSLFKITSNQVASGLNTQSGDTFLTTEPILDTSHPFQAGGSSPPPDLILTGTNGRDNLIGGAGNDTIDGKGGKDLIITGDGNDLVLFDTSLGKNNIDTVTDFSVNFDTIILSSAVFGAVGPVGTLAPDAFFFGSAAHDTSDRILYSSSSGALSYDPDGTGHAKATQFATLSPNLNLSNFNFKIV